MHIALELKNAAVWVVGLVTWFASGIVATLLFAVMMGPADGDAGLSVIPEVLIVFAFMVGYFLATNFVARLPAIGRTHAWFEYGWFAIPLALLLAQIPPFREKAETLCPYVE